MCDGRVRMFRAVRDSLECFECHPIEQFEWFDALIEKITKGRSCSNLRTNEHIRGRAADDW